MVTLIFGLKLKKVAAPSSMLFVLGGFVAWHVAMEIILFCLVYVRKYSESVCVHLDAHVHVYGHASVCLL